MKTILTVVVCFALGFVASLAYQNRNKQPETYHTKIVAVNDVKGFEDKGGPVTRDAANGIITLDPPVTNDSGLLIVDLPNKTVKITALYMVPDERGTPTSHLCIQWAPKKDGFTSNDLVGCKARFYAYEYPPETLKLRK